jgi:glycosidase
MAIRDLLGDARPDSIRAVRQLLTRAIAEAPYTASPADWRDEVLYFLLPDRFSDGRESTRPLLTRDRIAALRAASGRPDMNWHDWATSGRRWQGGTLAGIRGRLDYLDRLGVTALWIGPVFKQRARLDTFHGYGIQDFLDVDPRFGTRADLLDLVEAAHGRGMRIILDIIVNHSGDNWGYVPPGQPPAGATNEPAFLAWPAFYGNPADPAVAGWSFALRDELQTGAALALAGVHDAVWPIEFQSPARYTRAGSGSLGGSDVGNPHAEHKRTDFFTLKDIALDTLDTLACLVDCYKYWIAITDCDGFRIDTVKHMSLEETRNFCGAIREFSDRLGKRNFLLVGEIAGGDNFQDFVLDNLAVLRRNLSGALDIGSARLALHDAAKGLRPAAEYFDLFAEATAGFESHRALGDRHVSILDDHDHVFGAKVRFSAGIPDRSAVKDHQVAVATALQLFTLGIPCIYYGTEQAFAGPAENQLPFLSDEGWNDGSRGGDRFLREAMFGPDHPRATHESDLQTQLEEQDAALPGFGPFGTTGAHAFDTSSPAYRRIAALCQARAQHPVLRIGRQYARQVRVFGGFDPPAAGELVAWSRLLDTSEAVVVVNPNGEAARGGDVVISSELSGPGDDYVVVVNSAEAAVAAGTFTGAHPAGSRLPVRGREHPGEPAFLSIEPLPPAEVLVLVRAG